MWRAALLFSLPFGILTDLSESARVALSVSIRVIKPVSLVRPKTWRSAAPPVCRDSDQSFPDRRPPSRRAGRAAAQLYCSRPPP